MSDWNDVPNSPQGQGPGTPPPAQQPWGQQPQQPQPFGAPPQQQFSGAAPTFTLAPWIKRVGASLIDGVIFGVIYGIGAITKSGIAFALFALVAIVFGIWNTVFRQGSSGQTIGKSALGLKLVRESDAQPVGPGLSFGRQIAHILDGIFYIGYLWPLWDSKRQTFADKVCHTVVVEGA